MGRVNSFSCQWAFHIRRLSRNSGVFFFFCQFCDHPQLGLSQIWLQVKKESKKSNCFSKPLLYTWDLQNLNLYVLNMVKFYSFFPQNMATLGQFLQKSLSPPRPPPPPKKSFHQQSRKALGHWDSQKCVELLELGGERIPSSFNSSWEAMVRIGRTVGI